MKKIHITLIIVITIIVTLLVDVVAGDYIAARLSTLPLVKRLNLLQQHAPIVINNRETVRVSDANDAVQTTNDVKSKISTLVYIDNGHLVQTGTLLNWTSDGYFITAVKAFAVPGKTYAVVLNNGDIFPVKNIYPDPASSLVLVDTDASNLAHIDTVEDKDLRPGEKILLLANNLSGTKTTFLESYIHSVAADLGGQELNSDEITRGASIQQVGGLLPGQPGVDLDGKAAGIWTGDTLLSSDAIRVFANNFFNDNKVVNRPAFGFRYREVTSVEAKATQSTAGALVTAVTAGSPAAAAGLQAGDIITSVNDTDLTDDIVLETQLETVRPAGRASLDIVRKGASQILVITPILLK